MHENMIEIELFKPARTIIFELVAVCGSIEGHTNLIYSNKNIIACGC